MTWIEFDQEVIDVADKAAHDIHRVWGGVIPLEDLRQEAQVFVATHADTANYYLETPGKGLGAIRRWVRKKLIELCESEHGKTADTVKMEMADLDFLEWDSRRERDAEWIRAADVPTTAPLYEQGHLW